MSEKSAKDMTQVKVDNWGIFLQQRMYHFLISNEHWDLTLRFSTSDKLKVHRLVLFACTDYFQSMSMKNNGEDGDCLELGSEMDPQVVIPIIHFMYTGRLEFPVQLYEKLYDTALKLKMKILAKLIDGHRQKVGVPSKNSSQLQIKPPKDNLALAKPTRFIPENGTVTPKSEMKIPVNNLSSSRHTHSQSRNNVTTYLQTKKIGNDIGMDNGEPMEQVKRIITFESRINKEIVKVTKEVLTSVPVAKKVGSPLPDTFPGRRLPVWIRKLPEPSVKIEAKPTRFEWDEELGDIADAHPIADTLKVLSHDKDINVLQPIELNDDGTRVLSCSTSENTCDSSLPVKRMKLDDLNAMKEHCKQQQLRSEMVKGEDDDEDDDDVVDIADDDDVNDDGHDIYTDVTMNQSSQPEHPSVSHLSTPKPILKTVSKDTPHPKRVRFSLEGKENETKSVPVKNEGFVISEEFADEEDEGVRQVVIEGEEDESVRRGKRTMSPPMMDSKEKLETPALEPGQLLPPGNVHAKIVSEVLKKYPNLVRHSRNIKLKILTKPSVGLPSTVQSAVQLEGEPTEQKVQYVLVKNTPRLIKPETKLFDPENSSGPWNCNVCKNSEDEQISFKSYQEYRAHITEIHSLKIDGRICEYCGVKCSKRNHFLHHLFTKHNVKPPNNIVFPKCKLCDYVALSTLVLERHMSSHTLRTEYTCDTCGVFFRSHHSLRCHMNSYYHKENARSSYPCPYCDETCNMKGVLNQHILKYHWHQKCAAQDEEDAQFMDECADVGIEMKGEQKDEKNSQPSSELEALSTVASGIATSLTLVGGEQNIIYYDQNYVEGGEATVPSGIEVQEYIVPDDDYSQEVEDRIYSEESELVVEEQEETDEQEDNEGKMLDEGVITSLSDHDYTDQHQQIMIAQQPGQLLFQQPSGVVVAAAPANMVLSADGQLIAGSNVVLQPSFILSNQLLQHNIEPGASGIIFTNPGVVPDYYTADGSRVIMSAGPSVVHEVVEQDKSMEEQPELEIVEQEEGEVVETGGEVEMGESGTRVTDEVVEVMDVEEEEEGNEELGVEEEEGNEELGVEEEGNEELGVEEEEGNEELGVQEEGNEELGVEEERNEGLGVEEEGNEELGEEEEEEVQEIRSNTVSQLHTARQEKKIDTSKLVDDWDENNTDVNIEQRSDCGPSRATFF